MPATEFTYFDGLTKYERTRLRRIIRLLHRVYLHSFRSFFLVDLRSAVIRHGYAAGLLPLTAEDWEQLARQPVLRELATYLPTGEQESFGDSSQHSSSSFAECRLRLARRRMR